MTAKCEQVHREMVKEPAYCPYCGEEISSCPNCKQPIDVTDWKTLRELWRSIQMEST